MSSLVQIQKEGGIAVITIQREKALNALNRELLLEIRQRWIELEGIRVAILTGAGPKAFVAGADIAEMQKLTPLEARAFVELGQGVIQLIEESPFITIAAVNGFALGGGLELALACDLIYASENAKLGLPETNLGIIPGFGGTVNLIKRIGFHRAMELTLTGDLMSAAQAKDEGLVLHVTPPDQLMSYVQEKANLLAKKGLMSLLSARRLIRGMNAVERERGYLLERETFATLFAAGEPQEGMTAFLEKRAPRFHH